MAVLFIVLIVGTFQIVSSGDANLPQNFLYFPNLEAIKAFFQNASHPIAKEILETFERDCMYMEDPGVPFGRRKPFIVIEGNHRGSRDVVAMKLARRLNGRYLNNLAPCLFELFQKLQQGSVLRRVFYLLSVYASVFNAKVHVNLNRAVVLNGYWWEQVTFSLLQSLKGAPLPPASADIFQYPADLLQPDFIVYIDQGGNLETSEHSLIRNRSLELYRQLSTRHPIMIQSMANGIRTSIDEIYYNVRQNLSAHRDFRHKADPYYDEQL